MRFSVLRFTILALVFLAQLYLFARARRAIRSSGCPPRTNSMVFLRGCLEEMIRARARYGTGATLGNHEQTARTSP